MKLTFTETISHLLKQHPAALVRTMICSELKDGRHLIMVNFIDSTAGSNGILGATPKKDRSAATLSESVRPPSIVCYPTIVCHPTVARAPYRWHRYGARIVKKRCLRPRSGCRNAKKRCLPSKILFS